MLDEKKPEANNSVSKNRPSAKALSWVFICIAVLIVSLCYHLMVREHLEQTSLLFIGIPFILAVCLVFTPKPKSVTGTIMKGMTLALLLSGVLLVEGFICIIMAAPLFYLVGGIIGVVEDHRRRKEKSHRMNCMVYGVILLMSLEGIHDALSFPRAETVMVTEEVSGSISEARAQLNAGPQFVLRELPGFLKLGFPQPRSISGEGTEVGDQWRIHFAGGEGSPGDLVLEVTASSPTSVTFTCIDDSSHVAHWMDWKTITWSLSEGAAGKTHVSMQLDYDRLLDPAWYFKPIERYGVKKAGQYLISQTFTMPTDD